MCAVKSGRGYHIRHAPTAIVPGCYPIARIRRIAVISTDVAKPTRIAARITWKIQIRLSVQFDSAASLEDFVGHPAYGITQLRDDLERFAFLLGGSDGEPLFGP
jgi:hypothetical protein